MKKFTFEYVQKRSSDITVLACTREEAEEKIKKMEENNEIDMDHPEYRGNHFTFMYEKDADPDETIPVDCVEKSFDGDILITDPSYLRGGMDDLQQAENYWRFCFIEHSFDKFEIDNERLFNYGLKNTLVGRTIYGDWLCTVFRRFVGGDYDIGHFCADAGLVGVFLLDEVKRFNPVFCEWLVKHQQCGTVISDFKGTVKAITTRHAPEDKEHDIPLLTHTVHLEGAGKIHLSDDIFEFYTQQTGY